MKYIFLVLSFLISINSSLNAQDSIKLERAKVTGGGAVIGLFGSLLTYQAFSRIYDHLEQIKKGDFRTYLQSEPGIIIDSMPKLITVTGLAVGGAILGGGLAYWLHLKADKEFAANKFEHLKKAQSRFNKLKNNESIKNAVAAVEILDIEAWFAKNDQDSSYNFTAPVSSAYHFIFNKRDELIKIKTEYEKLALYLDEPHLSTVKTDLKEINEYLDTLNHLLKMLLSA